MATLADGSGIAARAEERFFFRMSCAMALVIVVGFSLHLAMGRSSFAVPPVYHFHAFVFFGWVALLVTQSAFIAGGNLALHRRLGWLSLLWIPLMAGSGMAITVASLQRTGGPFFFDANEFMISNPLSLLTFAALALAGVALRRRSDWHRRLMLSATASILGPGFGRILPAPLFGSLAWEITSGIGLIFILVGMWRDRRRLGHVHPAWVIGLTAGIGWIALGQLLAYTGWGIALTEQIMAGHPGAARPMEAYLPPGMP
ncbi:MAG: hypothetical protein ACK442_05845 [Novosphingobium sp.]|jgi:hypothetical protein|nr:hypothetical protein [Novosphingobium sp.]